MRKIKQFILFLIIFSSFGIVNLVKATEIEPVTNLYDFSDYFDRDYSKYANSTWSGAYYRVGIMGHKQFIEFGDISIKAYRIEDIVPEMIIGQTTNVNFTTKESYSIVDEVTSSCQIKIGLEQMVEAAVDTKDVGSVGTSTKYNQEYNFALECMYSEALTQETLISQQIDFEQMPDDKRSVSYSRVAIFIEFEIKSSYTKEHKLYGWTKLSNTEKNDYTMRYYIKTVNSYCYNDNTFGDVNHLYQLNYTLKSFE